MISITSPLAYMLQDDALVVENLENDLEAISKVVNIDYIKSKDQNYVNHHIWNSEAYVAGYTDSEFSEMKAAYWDLVLQNPMIFLENRVLQFLAANEMALEDGFPFVLGGNYSFEQELQTYDAAGKFLLFYPISNTLRSFNYLLKLMLDRSVFRWSFNFIIEVAAILVCAFKDIIRRDWYRAVMNVGFLGLSGALFLLTPEANMMYYLGIYYLGLTYIFIWILKNYIVKERDIHEDSE